VLCYGYLIRWNTFLFAVTLSKLDRQPITVALAQLAALPTLLVYIIFGRDR